MSDNVFPVLPGLAWPEGHQHRWKTERTFSGSGRRFATSYWSYPIRKMRFRYNFLRATEQEERSLIGFFDQHQGAGDTWLWTDPVHNEVVTQSFGIGDGSTTQWALVAPVYGQLMPIGAVNGSIVVLVNDTPTVDYTLVDGRLVSFNNAPAGSATLKWSGEFYFRCAFTDDEMDFERFMQGFYSADGVEFETIKP